MLMRAPGSQRPKGIGRKGLLVGGSGKGAGKRRPLGAPTVVRLTVSKSPASFEAGCKGRQRDPGLPRTRLSQSNYEPGSARLRRFMASLKKRSYAPSTSTKDSWGQGGRRNLSESKNATRRDGNAKRTRRSQPSESRMKQALELFDPQSVQSHSMPPNRFEPGSVERPSILTVRVAKIAIVRDTDCSHKGRHRTLGQKLNESPGRLRPTLTSVATMRARFST